jgi:hypothetical protein
VTQVRHVSHRHAADRKASLLDQVTSLDPKSLLCILCGIGVPMNCPLATAFMVVGLKPGAPVQTESPPTGDGNLKLWLSTYGRTGMLILIIVLVLLFGGGFGYRYRDNYGPHIGCGTILLIALIFWLLNGRL